MMGLELAAPDHTTLSRRGQQLDLKLDRVLTCKGVHLIIDSTGLSIRSEGEWAVAKHGRQGRRAGKASSGGVDRSGVIVAHALTEATVDDATRAIELIGAKVKRIDGDTQKVARIRVSGPFRPQDSCTNARIACNVLNQMTDVGRPEAYSIGR